MEPVNKNALCSPSAEWTEVEKQTQGRPSDSEETSFLEADEDSKIKPEIELKEETGGFVYKTDFRGHLQLVSLTQDIPNLCNATQNNLSGEELTSSADSSYSTPYYQVTLNSKGKANADNTKEWSSSKDGQVLISWAEESECPVRGHVYRQLKTLPDGCAVERYYIKEEPHENSSQESNYGHSLPEIYDYSSDSTWEPQSENSSQVSSLPVNLNLNGKTVLLTQAEKKRLYRMRIKEENPSMWSTIKKKEAARKRELREQRRHVLYEMQKTMELSIAPNSPDAVNQKLYLEALKERYPELWNQLLNALPATQMRNEQFFNQHNHKSRKLSPKPAKMYKDVIEAQKKRLYRQRIREERPEMYERQKAREAYARSLQRLMLKKKHSVDQNEFHLESLHPNDVEKKLTYLHNIQVENIQYPVSKRFHSHFTGDANVLDPDSERKVPCGATHTIKVLPLAEETPIEPSCHTAKSDPSQICDNKQSENEDSIAKSVMLSSDDETTDGNRNKFPTLAACSKQSDILWYWNDVRGFVEDPPPHIPWRRGPQVLTEEERLQKILKERIQLREKRRRYRMNMTPERRMEFLEIERERLKVYRLKKKAAEAASNEMVCVDQ